MAQKSSYPLGKQILSCIRSVLQRCEEVGEKVGYPGEGGERRFRKWIASDLLEQVLGWPSKNVVVGERFDVLLLSDEDHALATIETKTPYHKASKKERSDFEERLSGFPTLRTAYFTNGPEWDRLDIVVSGAELRVLERATFDLNKHSPAYAEQFFAPLLYRSGAEISAGQLYQVNRSNPFISGTLSRLAADLDDTVGEFTALYRQMFYGLREGRAGQTAQEVAAAIYSQWCGKSLRVTPETAVDALKRTFQEEGVNHLSVTRTLAALGLDGPATPQVVEAIMGLAPSRRNDGDALTECLWPAFAPSIDQLSAQTAHVVLARALLYRVGEDEKVFPRRLSGPELHKQLDAPTTGITGRKFRATELLESVRAEMQTFLPTVYLRGEFDWWAVLPEKRALLKKEQLGWLRQFDDEMERLNKLLLRRLSHYQFESVDVDIWRNIYENYLPEDERQRLGGFYTPDELVNLILDLNGYTADQEGLCTLSYIDPACGSGAFVTTALGRLMTHLDRDMPCHKELAKPGAARYLVQNYERLQGRVFKKKNIRKFNRRWYEYLWPRDAGIMLAKPRILSPTLIRQVRFVLDETGYLSDHACLMIQPTKKTSRTWDEFAKRMNAVVGEMLAKKQLLRYCVAFMNSSYAQERLKKGHRPTPKGSYAITEAYLREIPIPAPSEKRTVNTIMKLVEDLERHEFDMTDRREVGQMEKKLEAAVHEALQAVAAQAT